jgi:hypothetical protein
MSLFNLAQKRSFPPLCAGQVAFFRQMITLTIMLLVLILNAKVGQSWTKITSYKTQKFAATLAMMF